jgi:hypothetical protein
MKKFFIGFLAFVIVITAFCFIAPRRDGNFLTNAYATVTTTSVESGYYTSVQNCLFGVDADTVCNLTFSFPNPNSSGVVTNTPDVVTLTPIANSSGTVANGAIFVPFINSIGAGTVQIAKPTTAGSGGNIVRVVIQQFHSIIK